MSSRAKEGSGLHFGPIPRAPRIRAYAVTDVSEGTGGIVFAKNSAAARRTGASRYGDGDFSSMSCRRAAFADKHADTGHVPASLLIENGWFFECSGCGERIEYDALLDRDIYPEDVVGDQDSHVYCNTLCEAEDRLGQAIAKRMEIRWIRRFRRIIKARFPEAVFPQKQGSYDEHAYATKREGKWRVEQVSVAFRLPCTAHGPATLSLDATNRSRSEKSRKPVWRCCQGDLEAFERYAAENPKRENHSQKDIQ